ncbi:capsular polysaccharide biosynthesis protein [Bacteroidia bacterium]|nr:capsular polysaccharide biosynthesis protein [Bacteroidia bacterium]GHU66816.1 capsular polysaccharide biosynthesis protein [Bacteroidia bacterium]
MKIPYLFIFLSFIGYFNLNAQEITLLFAGDAMQHQKQLDAAYRNGKYDYSSYFQHIQPEIEAADLAVVNLETTLGGKPYKGYPMFCSPDAFAEALKAAGFDVFLNANNHILDRFSKGINRTLNVLDSLNVQHTGVFRDSVERALHYPLIIEQKGIRIAFLNYTYATNGIEVSPPVVVNYIDTIQMKRDIQKAKNQFADVIIANMHWGDEYKLLPNRTQKKLARFLVREGVDIVMGSHPHVVQPSLALSDSTGQINHLIIYSLGNFVSGMTAVNTDGGQMIKIVLRKQWNHIQIVSCQYSLIYTARIKNGNYLDYTLIPVLSPVELDEANRFRMKRFSDNARKSFEENNRGVFEDQHSVKH